MTTFVYANNVNTTLAAAASNTATTLTLASSANLPTLGSGQIMALTLNDAATRQVFEVVYVTAISGASLTVVRAQEGTGAQNWSIGDYAFADVTAGELNGTAQDSQVQNATLLTSTDTGAVNAYAITLAPAPAALVAGMTVVIDNIAHTNTAASTFNLNGLGALPIQMPGGVALSGGELVSGYGAVLRLNHGGTDWILMQTTGVSLTGAGQAWSIVTGSRAMSTVYTNSTGRTKRVNVYAQFSLAAAALQATINGTAASVTGSQTSAANAYSSIYFAVANGETYEVSPSSGSVATFTWSEA